jgi:hypothetical protein
LSFRVRLLTDEESRSEFLMSTLSFRSFVVILSAPPMLVIPALRCPLGKLREESRSAPVLPVPSRQEIEQNASYKSPEEAQLAGREARFRVKVVSAYNFTCALSAYRLTTITAGRLSFSVRQPTTGSDFREERGRGEARCRRYRSKDGQFRALGFC